MAYSTSAVRTNVNTVYPDMRTPNDEQERPQEISDIASEALQNVKGSSDNPLSSKVKHLEYKDQEINMVKVKLKALLQFDKFCERGALEGLMFSSDGKFVVDRLGQKRLLADFEVNYNLMLERFHLHLELQGYSYNPISGLLTNGVIETVEQTQTLMKGFFENKEIIADLEEKFKVHDIIIDDVAIRDSIDFEEVKSTIKLFMVHDDFIALLKKRCWRMPEMSDTTQVISPGGEIYYFKGLYSKWIYQKNEVLQSLKGCGFGYNSKTDLFKYHLDVLTFDEVYDLIKGQVVDDLIIEAQLMGFIYDTNKRLFIKEGSEATIREVVIQVNLNHIGL